jgi:outer membrane protein assembly factor BamE
MRVHSRFVLCLSAALFLAACSIADRITPYKLDVQQGNVVTQEMMAKLKLGMNKSQVRFILGTPLITDAFHADRWDYVYRYQKAGTLSEERHVALIFEGDTLKRVSGDVVAAPSGDGTKASALPESKPAGSAAPAAEEKGFFGKMLEKVGL